MIPEYPQFKSLQLSDKGEIEKIASRFPPYSAFNFTNLWIWDIRGDRKISILNGNLVVLFTDYATGEPFLSFLGINKCDDTVSQLLKFAKDSHLHPQIRFVTEESVRQLKSSPNIIEDRDNSDYIFSTARLAELDGSELKSHRHLVTRFTREYPNSVFSLEKLSDPIIQENISSVLRRWEDAKKNNKKTS